METLRITQLPQLPPQSTQSQQQTSQQAPQPTPQPVSPPNNEFIAFEDMMQEFETEKESTSKPQVENTITNDEETLQETAQNIYAPASSDIERPAMDDTEARKQTEIAMTMRQTLQSYGIAWYADGSLSTAAANKYNYAPADFNKLVEAWMLVVQQANLRIPPMANILLTEVVCTGPVFGLMAENRKMRKQLEFYKNKEKAEQTATERKITTRPDTKTAWSLGYNASDVYGYFMYTANGIYIQKHQRTTRPDLTPENVALIKKHNGAEVLEKLSNK